mgnify:CR=1 FL=1
MNIVKGLYLHEKNAGPSEELEPYGALQREVFLDTGLLRASFLLCGYGNKLMKCLELLS